MNTLCLVSNWWIKPNYKGDYKSVMSGKSSLMKGKLWSWFCHLIFAHCITWAGPDDLAFVPIKVLFLFQLQEDSMSFLQDPDKKAWKIVAAQGSLSWAEHNKWLVMLEVSFSLSLSSSAASSVESTNKRNWNQSYI